MPGQSRDNPVKSLFMCFLIYCFFFFLALKRASENTSEPRPEKMAEDEGMVVLRKAHTLENLFLMTARVSHKTRNPRKNKVAEK